MTVVLVATEPTSAVALEMVLLEERAVPGAKTRKAATMPVKVAATVETSKVSSKGKSSNGSGKGSGKNSSNCSTSSKDSTSSSNKGSKGSSSSNKGSKGSSSSSKGSSQGSSKGSTGITPLSGSVGLSVDNVVFGVGTLFVGILLGIGCANMLMKTSWVSAWLKAKTEARYGH